jgi:hypothetical protein
MRRKGSKLSAGYKIKSNWFFIFLLDPQYLIALLSEGDVKEYL